MKITMLRRSPVKNGLLILVKVPSALPVNKKVASWRLGRRCQVLGIDLPLMGEDLLVAHRVLGLFNVVVEGELSTVGSIASRCISPNWVCRMLRSIEYWPLGEVNGSECYTVPIPPIEPASTILGFTTIIPLTRILGLGLIYEVYSDQWAHLIDLLLYLKLRGVKLAVYTSNVGNVPRHVFDKVVERGRGIFEVPQAVEGPSVEELEKLVFDGFEDYVPLRAVVDSGIDIDAVNKLIIYNRARLSLMDGNIVLRRVKD